MTRSLLGALRFLASAATAAAMVWLYLRLRQNSSRTELGDGDIQTLFDDHNKSN
jgi:hypothetical protein